jgi:presenilin-like A22 family membrane protease
MRHMASILVAFLLMFVYVKWNKPWLISDVLSICIMGSLIKLFKIASMRDSIKFFLPCIIFDIMASTYATLSIRYVEYIPYILYRNGIVLP